MISRVLKLSLSVALYALLSSCSHVQEPATTVEATPGAQTQTALPPTAPTSPIPESVEQKVRAVGISDYGKLLIVSTDKETVEQLGAPSCNGTAEDYRMEGNYRIEFSPAGQQPTVLALLKLSSFIQPNDEPIPLQKMTFGDHEIFAIIPNYADCHGIMFYLIEVSKNGAFPMQFATKEGTFDHYDYTPNTQIKADGSHIIVQHGGGAGNESVDTQRFSPDFTKHVMELVRE